jgi:predicted kinase
VNLRTFNAYRHLLESNPRYSNKETVKPTLLSLLGLPRSGKSTITARLRRELGVPVVNADSIRLALHGQRYEALAETFVFAIREVMVRSLFNAGHDLVIYDETNFSRATRNRMKSSKWDNLYLVVDTPAEVCKERAIATEQPDLLPVIDAMAARYEPLGDDERRVTEEWVIAAFGPSTANWRS